MMKSRPSDLQLLPTEVLLKIYTHLHPEDYTTFAQTCKTFGSVSRDIHSRACAVATRFGGYKLALCESLLYIINPSKRSAGRANTSITSSNPASVSSSSTSTSENRARSLASGRLESFTGILTPTVATVLVQKGAIVPRYLCQLAIKDVAHVPPSLFSWLVQTGLHLYGCEAKFYSDDHATVTKIVMDAVLTQWASNSEPSDDLSSALGLNSEDKRLKDLSILRDVISRFGYIPMSTTGRTGNLSYFLFKLANMDISLLTNLQLNGFRLSSVNDEVLKWVLRRQTTGSSPVKSLSRFLSHGFVLTPAVISHGLQLCRPDVLEALRKLTPGGEALLREHARSTIMDLLGPKRIYTMDGILDHIRASFSIPDSVIKKALLGVPQGNDFKTRPYHQQHPATAWKWTLRHFGPDHELTRAVFDDVLRKLASGPASHCCLRSLPDQFVRAGVKFEPSHLKHIASMMSSEDQTPTGEDMDSLAEHLINLCKSQLTEADWNEKAVWVETLHLLPDNKEMVNKVLSDIGSYRRSKRLRKS